MASARLFLLLLLAIGAIGAIEARRHRPRELASEESPADVDRESREEESADGGGSGRTPETLESKTILQELPKDPFDGPKNPFDGPKNPFDEPKPAGGLFGPMNPECFDKRCNPFRKMHHYHHRPPVYYRRYLDKESGGPFGPPKGSYYQQMMKPKYPHHLPEYTEVIIIRKVPIMLSKLLVIAKANADGYKPKPKPDYPVLPPDPVLLKKEGGQLPPTKEVPPEMDELEEQLTLQRDQPTVELQERKGKRKYDPKDGSAFESLMGNEESVPLPEAKKGGEKGLPEGKKTSGGKGGEGEGEVKARQMATEYLERPAEGGDREEGRSATEQRLPREE